MRRGCILIVFLLIILSVTSVNAKATECGKYLSSVRRIDPHYLDNYENLNEELIPLVSPYGDTVLINFVDSSIRGYAIFSNDVLLEFSQGASPYETIECSSDESYYYDFTSYSTVPFERVKGISYYSFDFQSGQKGDKSGVLQSKILSGVTPKLQGNSNCIAAAIANTIWYWKTHGYPALTTGLSFNSVKSIIHNMFYDVFTNNKALGIADSYAGTHGGYSFLGGAKWNPSFSYVRNEIDSGNPCLVGFAPGAGSYSTVDGHMTMCFGYYIYGGTEYYVVLADGHSSTQVTKRWSSLNDCVIRLRIYP